MPTKTPAKKALKKVIASPKKNATPATKAGSTEKSAKVPYDEKLGKKAAAQMILGAKGIISVYVKKQDGTHRWIAGRVKETAPDKAALGQVNIWDMVEHKMATINLPEAKFVKKNKVTYKIG